VGDPQAMEALHIRGAYPDRQSPPATSHGKSWPSIHCVQGIAIPKSVHRHHVVLAPDIEGTLCPGTRTLLFYLSLGGFTPRRLGSKTPNLFTAATASVHTSDTVWANISFVAFLHILALIIFTRMYWQDRLSVVHILNSVTSRYRTLCLRAYLSPHI
jgi:hypothetical protein